jgi:hypothetical protein
MASSPSNWATRHRILSAATNESISEFHRRGIDLAGPHLARQYRMHLDHAQSGNECALVMSPKKLFQEGAAALLVIQLGQRARVEEAGHS